MSGPRAGTAGRIGTFIILTVAALAIIAPFAWIFRGALSPSDAALYRLPPSLSPADSTLANFGKVFRQVPYLRFVVNSLVVAGSITLIQLVTCSTAGYAFARLNFPGKRALFAVVIGSLMIPIQVTIVPLFLAMSKVGLTNTLWALILPPVFSGFGIFLLRQHFLGIPRELEEAAKLDGAGYARTFLPGGAPPVRADHGHPGHHLLHLLVERFVATPGDDQRHPDPDPSCRSGAAGGTVLHGLVGHYRGRHHHGLSSRCWRCSCSRRSTSSRPSPRAD